MSPSPWQRAGNWTMAYVVRPLGQIGLFTVGSIAVMTIAAFVVAFVLRTPWHGIALLKPMPGIDLVKQTVVQLPSTIIDGLSIGFVYAMIALGYTMVYGVLQFVNFAHSEIFMTGGVAGYVVIVNLYNSQTLASTNPWIFLLLIVLVGPLVYAAGVLLVKGLAGAPEPGVARQATSQQNTTGDSQKNAQPAESRIAPVLLVSGPRRILIVPLVAATLVVVLLAFANPAANPILLILFMLLVGMAVAGVLAVMVERLAYRPLRRAPRLVPLIAAIGVSFFLQDFVRAIMALTRNEFNFSYPTDQVPFLAKQFSFSTSLPWPGSDPVNINASIGMNAIIVIIVALIMLIGLNYFVTGTRAGKGIRAVSQDQATASLMGINVNRMIALTFFIGGGLGGAAGVLFGMKTGYMTPYIGFFPGLKAFTAAVLGGIGDIQGAMLGGILLGVLEAFFAGLLPYFPALGTGYRDILAFGVLILILIFRPAGLLGKSIDEKV